MNRSNSTSWFNRLRCFDCSRLPTADTYRRRARDCSEKKEDGQKLERCYFATMLALIVHQIDAAYWNEWEMFAVPGGIQGFLVFNGCAVGAILWGYRSVLLQRRAAKMWSKACAVLGLGTFIIHAAFALAGRHEFALPLSMLSIVACGVCGAYLLSKANG
jgi:hypothetical protein